MLVCKFCATTYDEKHPAHSGGHYRICGDCEDKEDVPRSIGLYDTVGKNDVRIALIRNPTDAERQFVKSQNSCGPSHCHTSLGLASNGANSPKQARVNPDKADD